VDGGGLERRGFLRWVIGSAIAVATTLTAANLIISLRRPATITVKVVYFQMSQYVNVNDEFFTLQEPASICDLLNAIVLRHPSLSPKTMATMLILVNEVTATGQDYVLKNGDKVDFIPMTAGG
jgi:molybdopterin converting factor small subunit